MARARLDAALDEGLALPGGEALALRPAPGTDLDALGRDRTTIVHSFRPHRDAWARQGWRVADEAPEAAVAWVSVPRSKALARALVAQAAARAPLVLVDGQRADGVDALWREVRALRPGTEGVTLGHGRLFWFSGGPGFEPWASRGPERGADGLFHQPGVFSEAGADPASLLLARALPAKLPRRMGDLGAGVGVLSLAVLAREGVASLDLVEAEGLALDCARLNVVDERARFLWADALEAPLGPWDGCVVNPPFHRGREADPGLGAAFVAAAARALAPGGQLWLVANRGLPYEAALAEAFREAEALGAEGGFKILHARHPRRPGEARRPVVRRR